MFSHHSVSTVSGSPTHFLYQAALSVAVPSVKSPTDLYRDIIFRESLHLPPGHSVRVLQDAANNFTFYVVDHVQQQAHEVDTFFAKQQHGKDLVTQAVDIRKSTLDALHRCQPMTSQMGKEQLPPTPPPAPATHLPPVLEAYTDDTETTSNSSSSVSARDSYRDREERQPLPTPPMDSPRHSVLYHPQVHVGSATKSPLPPPAFPSVSVHQQEEVQPREADRRSKRQRESETLDWLRGLARNPNQGRREVGKKIRAAAVRKDDVSDCSSSDWCA